jgi:hypothetical protein
MLPSRLVYRNFEIKIYINFPVVLNLGGGGGLKFRLIKGRIVMKIFGPEWDKENGGWRKLHK